MLQYSQENNNDEFNVLQREYRNMESNRKVFTEECNLVSKKNYLWIVTLLSNSNI